MTEREKMLSGQFYDPTDPELCELRRVGRNAAAQFNTTNEDQKVLRQILMKRMFGTVGEETYCCPDVHVDYGCNVHLGDGCEFNFNTTFLDCAEIRFGDHVLVGPNCSFLTPLHPMLSRERGPRQAPDGHWTSYERSKPIHVCSNVWIGGNVTVLPGVTIGEGSVIGAGSVVTRDIPAGVLAVGNPCRVVRPITEEDSVLPID